MRASPKINPSARPATPASTDDAMVSPLHPMHRDLLLRMGSGEIEIEHVGRSSSVSRMAGLFYMGVGAWAVVGGAGYAVVRVIHAM